MKTTPRERLESLDILRGADMFFLGIIGPILRSYNNCSGGALPSCVAKELTHVNWEGFTCWDLIMPLFLFMSGISLPFSMAKYQTNKSFYFRLIKRVILLFIFGAIIQGNLLSLNIKYLHWFSNTLQAIAIGYLFTALIMKLKPSIMAMYSIFIGLILSFSCLLIFGGDYSPNGNFCEKIERLVMGSMRDGVWFDDQGTWHFSESYHYTWIISSLGFVSTVLLGAIAGKIIKNGQNKTTIIKRIITIGLVCCILGWLWSRNWIPYNMPIIKTIWTPSMTVFSGGICLLLLSFFYILTDYLKYGKYLSWLKIFGMNSIAAYILFELTHEWFNVFFNNIFFGLKQYTDNYYPLLLNSITCTFLILLLSYLYKRKIFIKI